MAFRWKLESKFYSRTNVIVNLWERDTDYIPDKILAKVLPSIKRKISAQIKKKQTSGHFSQVYKAINNKTKEVDVHWIIG